MTHPDSFDPSEATYAKKTLTDSLITLSPLFTRHDYFMQDEFGLCDVLLLPLLHRLPTLGINLPDKLCKPLLAYQTRLSARESFQKTLVTPIDDDDF